MYLTKLELDLTNPGIRAVLRDAQKLHQLVTGLFQCARKDANILFRCRGRGLYTDLYMYTASFNPSSSHLYCDLVMEFLNPVFITRP